MRLEHLKKWKRSLYNDLLLSGKLQQHLLDIDRDAREEFETIVRQTAKAEGVTEELKNQNQMEAEREKITAQIASLRQRLKCLHRIRKDTPRLLNLLKTELQCEYEIKHPRKEQQIQRSHARERER